MDCSHQRVFPRVFMTRQRIRDGSKYYGPYTDTGSARAVLDLIRELYPLRSCRGELLPKVASGKYRLCLDYHIKRCCGPCMGHVDEVAYRRHIERVRIYCARHVGAARSSQEGDGGAFIAIALRGGADCQERYQLVGVTVPRVSSSARRSVMSTCSECGMTAATRCLSISMHMHRGAVVRSVTLQYRRSMDEKPWLSCYLCHGRGGA